MNQEIKHYREKFKTKTHYLVHKKTTDGRTRALCNGYIWKARITKDKRQVTCLNCLESLEIIEMANKMNNNQAKKIARAFKRRTQIMELEDFKRTMGWA